MGDANKTYRIRTEVGKNVNLNVKLEQEYDSFEILSLKLTEEDAYKLQTTNYGVVAGRVLANGGFGVPNAKISIFIEADAETISDVVYAQLYPYTTTRDKKDGVRYNLLPDKKVDTCHKVVGTFPNKSYLLDNGTLLEIFDKYYKYTVRTNKSGDYIICGVPTGTQTVHMDLDISDCGVLSQRPRDFFYKGYNADLFESPNQFKSGEELETLTQIFSQDQSINVVPFWGNNNQGETIGITRCDIDVNFKFEPTCVFMGSVVSDNASNGITKRCVATNTMGAMDELVTGEGTIEMIRKDSDGNAEEFMVKGTELINADGIWCYQIPMNLDYMMTDEYGNMVPTDNPDKGIPTRARVRFRVSLHEMEANTDNYFLSKILIPNNPQTEDEVDYNFGTSTKDTSYRDLFWNNVYTVKSHIPRFQHSQNFKNERFTGIKHCNIYGQNNPMPYNNIRIRLPLMFTILCALIKTYIRIVKWVNTMFNYIVYAAGQISMLKDFWTGGLAGKCVEFVNNSRFIVLSDGLCPDLESWYFSPANSNLLIYYDWDPQKTTTLLEQTFNTLKNSEGNDKLDSKSIDCQNGGTNTNICLTMNTDYLLSCVEMNLAQEYRVINFDFYNDWINGVVYIPRWLKYVTKKRNFLWGLIKIPAKIKGCISSAGGENGSVSFGRYKRYTQQCALMYNISGGKVPTMESAYGCYSDASGSRDKYNNCHKLNGFKQVQVFGYNGGVIQEKITSKNQYVYYAKPCEWSKTGNVAELKTKKLFFATDLVLLGSLNDCNVYGIPQAFKSLSSSTYKMPTNLALTNMDDDSYVYGNTDGTICNGQNNDVKVTTIEDSALTYSNITKFYANSKDVDIKYYSLDEYVPVTEAAGISWNYSGPGQGPNEKDNYYYPGGHFLGLSCVNSETNIKSCVNLERICEGGATISQRREVITGVKYDSTSGGSFTYKYYVPSGLIARDEVNDGDFRTMFATLNQKRLIATGTDEKTGYPRYEFDYMRANSFNGQLADKLGGTYNNSRSAYTTIETSVLSGTTIDFDKDIKENTYTRTIEDRNADYYKFRMGLTGLTFDEQCAKYIYSNSGVYGLPQHENSYYFYFGLHAGATALDEFNKQFFSTCSEEAVETDGYTYKEIKESEVGDNGYKIYSEVPEHPTSSYPTYIKVGDKYYKLVYGDTPTTTEVQPTTLSIYVSDLEDIEGTGKRYTKTVSVRGASDTESDLLTALSASNWITNVSITKTSGNNYSLSFYVDDYRITSSVAGEVNSDKTVGQIEENTRTGSITISMRASYTNKYICPSKKMTITQNAIIERSEDNEDDSSNRIVDGDTPIVE